MGCHVFPGNVSFGGQLPGGFRLTRPFSIGVWAKRTDGGGLGLAAAGAGDWDISRNGASMQEAAYAYEEDGTIFESSGQVAPPASGWWGAVGLFVSTDDRRIVTKFGQGTNSVDAPDLVDPNYLFIAQFPDAISWQFLGKLGWVFFWDWQLTPAQIDRWLAGEVVDDSGAPWVFDLTQSQLSGPITDLVHGMSLGKMGANPYPTFDAADTPPVVYDVNSVDVQRIFAPDGTVSAGSWSAVGAATLHEAIDETIPVSFGDYIQSSQSPATDDVARVSVQAISDPGVSSPYRVSYTYGKDAVGGDTLNLTVRLMEGATEIAAWTHLDVPGGNHTAIQTLTTGEANAITDHNALELEFRAVRA